MKRSTLKKVAMLFLAVVSVLLMPGPPFQSLFHTWYALPGTVRKDLTVGFAGRDQFLMGSFSGKLTIVQYQDQIGLADAGCSLGYQEGGGVSTKLVKGFRSAASVAKSRALALSSRIRISGFFTRARAMVSL